MSLSTHGANEKFLYILTVGTEIKARLRRIFH